MKVDIERIKRLVDQCLQETPTGDAFIDAQYDAQVALIGHTNPYYRLFYMIAKDLKPSLSVELGSWRAIAAAHLAAGNPEGQVITIDHYSDPGDDENRRLALEADDKYPNLECVAGWTWDVAPWVPDGIELLFIDSWHEYGYAIRDWNDYSPKLASEALVIIDDVMDCGVIEEIDRFWAEVSEGRESFLDDRVHPGSPMGFMRC